MPLFNRACLGLLVAFTWAHAEATTRPVTLSSDCFKQSSQLFCTTFYRGYLSSCLRTVTSETFVLKLTDNYLCYIPSGNTECISAEICPELVDLKQPTVSMKSDCVI